MNEWVAESKTEIEYKGRKLTIHTVKRELLSNGWINFGVKSDDDTFLAVFGKNPIPMAVKPKQEFKAEYDLFQNTPEQRELARKIWHAIQENYFKIN